MYRPIGPTRKVARNWRKPASTSQRKFNLLGSALRRLALGKKCGINSRTHRQGRMPEDGDHDPHIGLDDHFCACGWVERTRAASATATAPGAATGDETRTRRLSSGRKAVLSDAVGRQSGRRVGYFELSTDQPNEDQPGLSGG